MRIVLYKNTAESTKVDKSSNLEVVETITGNFRTSEDISNPVILIDKQRIGIQGVADSDNVSVTDSSNIEVGISISEMLKSNYMYIEELERYYFIESISSVTNSLWSVSAHVDVLYTYKDKIMSMRALVERNEFAYNPRLVDSDLIVDSNQEYDLQVVSTPIFDESISMSDNCMVLTTFTKGE